uniref:hypothetical protein n=1 Tax=Ningiella ruwaisensis TaxID=2364274 RepID=UPI0010A01239|nr:hypothetical protein [Ningiella ruwaisensis]
MLTKAMIFIQVLGIHSFALAQQQDPTRPPNVMAQQLTPLKQDGSKFVLTAVFNRNAQRYAVLNGEIVKQGDEIAGMRVVSILDESIKLQELGASDNNIELGVHDFSALKGAMMKKQVVK